MGMADLKTARHDIGILILRIALGGILLFHGISKLGNGVEWMKQTLGQLGLPGVLAYGSYIAEVIAPILIILGFLTRPAALVIAFDMLMAVFLVLRQQIFTINSAGGGWAIELEALIFFVSLTIFFTGAGKLSVTRAKWNWD
jgi:putative oxidoreductase